jgi:hypothetical protein
MQRVPQYGTLVRVLREVHDERPENIEAVAAGEDAFFVFFPVGAAARQHIVQRAGRASLPPHAQAFPRLRARGAISVDGTVENWWIWDSTGKRMVDELSPSERRLSSAEVLNDTALISRIETRWSPEDTA